MHGRVLHADPRSPRRHRSCRPPTVSEKGNRKNADVPVAGFFFVQGVSQTCPVHFISDLAGSE